MSSHVERLAEVNAAIQRAYAERDAAVLAAHRDGVKLVRIAEAVGLSRATVHRIIKDAEGVQA